MPQKAFFPYCGAATLALGVVLSSVPAYAGFQWSEHSDSGAVQIASPTLSASKTGGVNREYISPLVITGTPVPTTAAPAPTAALPMAPVSQPAPSAAPASLLPQGTVSVGALPAPAAAPLAQQAGGDMTTLSVAPSAQNAQAVSKTAAKIDLASEKISATTPGSGSIDVVHGFASRVPLTLALRQILPSDHSFYVEQGVEMDTLVSYKGGKPWGETLKAALAPAGLDYREQGNLVTIVRAAAPAAPASALAEKTVPSLQPVRTQESGHFLPLPLPSEKQASAPAYNGWAAQRGDTLRKVLTNWCSRSGVELKWVAEYDYPVEASATFSGGFEDAVRSLLAGFDSAKPQPIGELHVNQKAGQNVLVVQVRGNSYTN